MATQEQIDQLKASQDRVNALLAKAEATDAHLAQGIQELQASRAKKEMTDINYTLFASGLNYGGGSSVLEGKNLTNDLAIIFDVVDQHSYVKTAEKTSYAIESRSKASDHVVINDGTFSFSARISDSPRWIIENNFIDKDTDPNNPMSSKRPAKSLEILEQIMDNREMVTLVTEDNILTNYVLTNLTANRSTDEGGALVFQIELQEFRLVQLGRTVLGKTADPKKAGNKNKGAVQTADGGKVSDEQQGKKSPYNGPLQKKLTEWTEDITGEKYDLTSSGDKIYRPGVGFQPSSLQR